MCNINIYEGFASQFSLLEKLTLFALYDLCVTNYSATEVRCVCRGIK